VCGQRWKPSEPKRLREYYRMSLLLHRMERADEDSYGMSMLLYQYVLNCSNHISDT
jgi:hypothetical protein